jgi:SAM-dependent methyltransferase
MKEYVLGTDEAEYRRLGLQHRLWAWHAHRVWETARIMPGCGVLDIGCGPGWAGMDIAGLVGPTGEVFGVDASANYVEAFNEVAKATHTDWASAVVGDVENLIEVAGGHGPFDVAWVRWVLCFLPSPDRVVRQAAELLRPGGRLVIQDYFNYQAMRLAPASKIFDRIVEAVGTSWIDGGGNPDVMGQIRRPIREASFRVVHFDVIERVARPGEQMWTWPTIFWASFLPRIVASGHLSEAEHQAFKAEWAERSLDEDAFMQLPPVYEIVAEKV